MMKYSNAANLEILEFLWPEIKFDFLFSSSPGEFLQNRLRSTGGLKYAKELTVIYIKCNHHD